MPSSRGSSVPAVARSSGRNCVPWPFLRTSIITAITIISSPNSRSSFWPSKRLPMAEPAAAPAMPAREKTIAQGQRTLPTRAWPTRFEKALSATATELVPMATWGEATPTT